MTSSIYPLDFVVNSPTINSGTNILSTPITIVSDHVSPGGGGIVRIYFSFTVTTNAIVSVLNNGSLKGNLNADNSAEVISNGYYRFDIDVEAGDVINLQSTVNITTVNLFRAHLIQFGA